MKVWLSNLPRSSDFCEFQFQKIRSNYDNVFFKSFSKRQKIESLLQYAQVPNVKSLTQRIIDAYGTTYLGMSSV